MTTRRTLGSGPAALAPVAPAPAVPARLLPVERAAVDEDQEHAVDPASLRLTPGRERRQLGTRGR